MARELAVWFQRKRAADAELAEKLSVQELAAKAKDDAAIWEALASEQMEAHWPKSRVLELAPANQTLEQGEAQRRLDETRSAQPCSRSCGEPSTARLLQRQRRYPVTTRLRERITECRSQSAADRCE
jgi:hypothetical protein